MNKMQSTTYLWVSLFRRRLAVDFLEEEKDEKETNGGEHEVRGHQLQNVPCGWLNLKWDLTRCFEMSNLAVLLFGPFRILYYFYISRL